MTKTERYIGLVAAVTTIFVFVTGIQSLRRPSIVTGNPDRKTEILLEQPLDPTRTTKFRPLTQATSSTDSPVSTAKWDRIPVGSPGAGRQQATIVHDSAIRVDGIEMTLGLKTDHSETEMRDWLDFQEATRRAVEFNTNASDVLLVQTKPNYTDVFRFAVEKGHGVYYLYVPNNQRIELGPEWLKATEFPARPFTRDDGTQGVNAKQEVYVRI